MNEISIITYLLSRTVGKRKRGATEEEIKKALHLPEKTARTHILNLFREVEGRVGVMGLEIRFNPLDQNWFLAFKGEVTELTGHNPFRDRKRLGATLFALLTLVFSSGNGVSLENLRKVRKKKDLGTDLKELEQAGFVDIDGDKVYLTPLVGYHCDLHLLFRNIELEMMKDQGETQNAR
ncbi:MAG: hypothetical protein ACTSU5_05975 [Promethearchaeota archaeon]